MGQPFDYMKTASTPNGTGKYSIRLTPATGNQMFGRSGFLVHGASTNPEHFGQASNGCIIMPLPIRHQIGASNDHRLEVVE